MSVTVYGVLDLKNLKIHGMLCTIATCNNMGIPVPRIIKEFFSKVGNAHPENLPAVYRTTGGNIKSKGEIWTDLNNKKWSSGGLKGLEINIENLPKELKKIRVVEPY